MIKKVITRLFRKSAKRLEQKDYELEQNDTKITQEWVGLGIKGAAELGDILIGIKKLSKLSKMFKK